MENKPEKGFKLESIVGQIFDILPQYLTVSKIICVEVFGLIVFG